MNATMKKLLKAATVDVELASSRYGTPSPTLHVSMPKTCSHRQTRAVVHMLAAELELAIPNSERWSSDIDVSSDYRGSIAIELLEGSEEEAERAMKISRLAATA